MVDGAASLKAANREFSGVVRPASPTVTLPCHEMGTAASRLLLQKMSGESESTRPYEVRGQLIVRESCGANLSNQ